MNIGFAGAAILAGLLAHVPRTTVFTIDAVTTALGAVWIFLRVPETHAGMSPASYGSVIAVNGVIGFAPGGLWLAGAVAIWTLGEPDPRTPGGGVCAS
jgi:hypothetical protein